MTTITDTWTLHVPDGYEVQEDTSITPGNYRLHHLKGGRYPITWTTLQGDPVCDPTDAYYAEVQVLSTVVREVHHERLGAATRNRVEELDLESSYGFRFYAYQVQTPGPVKFRPDLTVERGQA